MADQLLTDLTRADKERLLKIMADYQSRINQNKASTTDATLLLHYHEESGATSALFNKVLANLKQTT